jgi:hypothetical protein
MVTTLCLAAATGGGDPGVTGSPSLGTAILLVGTIVGLLALFALGAVLMAGFRRRRLVSGEDSPPEPLTDAWQEAGRRLEVPQKGESG